jgi:hypothetical protein
VAIARCALVAAGIVAQAVVSGNTPEGAQLLVLWLVVPYSVAAYNERSRALIGLAILLGAFVVYAAENTDITGGHAGNVGPGRSSWCWRVELGSRGSWSAAWSAAGATPPP